MGVCIFEDDFIKEKVHWIITLSDGTNVYQDDYRPGEEEPIAWVRLKKYIEENKLSIVEFKIRFFSHIEEVAPKNANGYFFIQKVAALAFSEEERTYKYYVVGFIDNDKIYTIDWLVPEILPVTKGERDLIENDPSVILNRYHKNGTEKN